MNNNKEIKSVKNIDVIEITQAPELKIPMVKRRQSQSYNEFLDIESKKTVENKETVQKKLVYDETAEKLVNVIINSRRLEIPNNEYVKMEIFRHENDNKFYTRDLQDLDLILSYGVLFKSTIKPLNDEDKDETANISDKIIIKFDAKEYRRIKKYERLNKAKSEFERVLDRWQGRKTNFEYGKNERIYSKAKGFVIQDYETDPNNNDIYYIGLGMLFSQEHIFKKETKLPIPEVAYNNELSYNYQDGFNLIKYIYGLYYQQSNEQKQAYKVKVKMINILDRCLVIPNIDEVVRKKKEKVKKPIIDTFEKLKELKGIIDYKIFTDTGQEISRDKAMNIRNDNKFNNLMIEFDVVKEAITTRNTTQKTLNIKKRYRSAYKSFK